MFAPSATLKEQARKSARGRHCLSFRQRDPGRDVIFSRNLRRVATGFIRRWLGQSAARLI